MNWKLTPASTLVWCKSNAIDTLFKKLGSHHLQVHLALAKSAVLNLAKYQCTLVGILAALMMSLHYQAIADESGNTASLLFSKGEPLSESPKSESPPSETPPPLPPASLATASLMVEKRVFEMPHFTTFGGKQIKNVKVGWEAYGTLNDAKSNVILITHYFSGSSHAAGKYDENDPAPGYWDSIIGPGKAIDTNHFYVISVDTLANLNAYDPHVVTTGPASINPDTGKPYGLDFPVVTIRDFVNVQKALLESLGISKLYAVIGPSMGSMQAIDWASAYPDWVERMISVIGAGQSDAWTTAALEHWATPITLDKNWNNGAYSKEQAPLNGLAASLMLITQNALTPSFFNQTGNTLGYKNVESAPLNDIRQSHSIVNWLRERAKTRAKSMDANHLLYLVRACQLFVAGHQGNLEQGLASIKAKTLFIPAQTDLLLMPYLSQSAHQGLTSMNNDSTLVTLNGKLGHLEGVTNVSAQAQAIRQFLENDKAAMQ